MGNHGDVVTALPQSSAGMRSCTEEGQVAAIEWRRLADPETDRLLLDLGHARTIDAAQGLTSDQHTNALPRGTSGVTVFTSYVAKSRERGTTWTVISEAVLLEVERQRQTLSDVTPMTIERLWKRAVEDRSQAKAMAV